MQREIIGKILIIAVMVLFVMLTKNAKAAFTPMDCPVTEHIADIWGTSGTNVFAVGHLGAILHYDGDGNNDGTPDEIWEVMVSTVGVDNDLRDIWGTSETNIFAVGRGRVLNYNGSIWTDISSTVGIPVGTDLYGVWGSSYSDVFIVGESGTVFHYNGNSWADRDISAVSSGEIHGIWGSSATDVFASNDANVIVHYNGTIWTMMHSASVPIKCIWGSSESDVFAVGENGTILHYDGSDWSIMDSEATETFYRVWGSSGTDVYVVGESGTILHYDGSWSAMVSGTSNLLYGVWGSSASDVFAVGEDGTILHYVPDVITTTTVATTTIIVSTTTTSTSVPDICIGEEIYGEYSEEAELLRCFREKILSRTLEGQELIRLYYEWSPIVVKTMEEDEEFKEEVKAMIDGILPLISGEIE